MPRTATPLLLTTKTKVSKRRCSRSIVFSTLLFMAMGYFAFMTLSFQSMLLNQQAPLSDNREVWQVSSVDRRTEHKLNESQTPIETDLPKVVPATGSQSALSPSLQSRNTNAVTTATCPFREYPPRRYYGLSSNETQPDFLKTAEYVYGEYPIVLRLHGDDDTETETRQKLCVNQSEWRSNDKDDDIRLPFADGTNPSLLRLDRVAKISAQEEVWTTLQKRYQATYLATICMTDSQCAWNETPEEHAQYNLSTRTTPNTVRTLLLILNDRFETILQTTIQLERNAPWGNWVKASPAANGKFAKDVRALDDARLFVNRNAVWISYREGKSFGWDKQVINPVHVELLDNDDGTTVLQASIQASESASFCCGRNMALLQHPETQSLQSLTWADPVTVVDVNDTVHSTTSRRRRLSSIQSQPHDDVPSYSHRQLRRQRQRKSHFHGTNAFMLPLPSGELLGIGHFHRPPGRDKNDYARFGHHYTHAFFAITRKSPHVLQRLSQEFVFPSTSRLFPDDAEVIQFASALELDEATGELVVGYGINDCEGAVIRVDLVTVEALLKPVREGQEVIDLMQPLMNSTTSSR